MNTNNPQSAATQDTQLDLLLDQALDVGTVSDDLQMRIIALSDPQMNALLDEALGQDELPDTLVGRINAAVQTELHATPSPVVGRIGFPSGAWHYAAAAAVAIASGLGIYFGSGFGSTDTANDDRANKLASLEEDFTVLAAVLDDDPTASLGLASEIDALAMRIDAVDDSFWGGDAGSFQDDLWQEISLENDDPLLF